MSEDEELRKLFDKFSQDPYCRLLGIRLLELSVDIARWR